jgi:2-polyprenyl-3-methyl-5-hydroxy-6-metoxy-1,4-benzoquinol methylase
MSNLYEFVRYPGKPFPQTHPDRLAAMAILHGMEPANFQSARVLEIGCCDGGNLLPIALSCPASDFTGIDLTESDIADARQTAADLALTNIHFHVMDLTDLPGPLGQFDYILVHGLYSWVPPPIREKMLAVIQASLSPNGVAFVSYNANPGGHVRQLVRDMLLFHVGDVQDPAAKIARAREFIEFFSSAIERSNQPKIVRNQIRLLQNQSDHSIFHDDLAEHYYPVYFHEFVAHANRCGLQYLSESGYFVTRPENLGSEAGPAYAQIAASFGGNAVPTVQYQDFMRCSYFHQTLLCHSDIVLDRNVRPERMKRFYFYSPADVVPPEPEADPEEEVFESVQGSRISSKSPFVRGLLHALIAAYPRSLPYSEFPSHGVTEEEVCGTLLALLNMGIVSHSMDSPQFSVPGGEQPVASPLARWQAARNRPLTDLRRSQTGVSTLLQVALIPLLDGTRTRADLLTQISPDLFPPDAAPEARPALLDEAITAIGYRCLLLS